MIKSLPQALGWSALWLVLIFSGCADNEYPEMSAYDEQPRLCANQSAFSKALNECKSIRQQGKVCGGVVAFEGKIQNVEVVVADPILASAEFSRESDERFCERLGLNDCTNDQVAAASTAETRHFVELNFRGISPYFSFVLQFKDTSIPVTTTTTTQSLKLVRTVERDPKTGVRDPLQAHLSLRISNGKESDDLQPSSEVGSLRVERTTPTEIEGTFRSKFEEDGSDLAGCFALMATKVINK